MAGPYGITQFDAAGVISNYQAMQENRIRSMILQKQMANEERKAEVQSGIQSALSRFTRGGRDESGALPDARPQTGAAAAVGAYGAPQPADPLAPLPDQAPAAFRPPQPAGPAAGDRQALFQELMALDVDTAGNVMEAFAKMDKATASAAADRNLRLMQIAAGIMQLPYEQRRAAIQQAAGELQGLGFKPEQLANFDPTDQNLRQIVAQGMDMERIVKFVLPDLMNVNGEVIDATAVGRGDADPVRYRSEFIETTNGLERRNNAGANNGGSAPRINNAQEYEALPPGTTYIDPNGVQRTKGGQAGGGSPGGFPGR